MQTLSETPKDMERQMNAHMRLAGLASCAAVVAMHRELSLFYRDMIRTAILSG